MDEPVVKLVDDVHELEGILELQGRNLERSLAPDEAARDGFVTVRHDLATLEAMHARHPSVVAVHDGRVVGYVIMMSPECRDLVPIIRPMFELFERIEVRGRPLSMHRYFVNGQVCVDEAFRGTGLFDAMMARYRSAYEGRFEMVVTEIAARNRRSLRAHERVGFRTVHRYADSVAGESWHVVVWDWTAGLSAGRRPTSA